MKHFMKKSLSITLALIMLLTSLSCVTAFAADKCDCGYAPSIVIPGIFQCDVRYLDENGNEMLNSEGVPYEAPFFMESSNEIVKMALEEALLPLASLLITQEDKEERAAKAISDVLGKALLSNLELDKYGQPIKNIKADEYKTSLANLTKEQREWALDNVPLNAYAQIAGLDHLYYHSFLHTGNIYDAAMGVYELIQIAKEETGHDKVNLVPISQGGSLENALMQIYKDKGEEFSDDINRVCYVVPAADGAYVLGDIYRYGVIDDDDALYGYMLPALLGQEQELLAYAITILLRIFPTADLNNILDTAVNTLVEDYLEYSTCLWGLIPSKDYPELRERFLTDEEDAIIREQTDWYYNAQVNAKDYILEAQAKGVEFFDLVDYNYTSYKIFDSWDDLNGDGIIHLDSESFGATSVAVGVPLAKDYVQANTYCTDPTHNHIDEERLVDASTGILCESTFFFKGQNHEATARNDVVMRLAIRILTDEGFTSVYSDPAYPQFNFARDSRSAQKLYNAYKGFDTSKLSEEDAAEFKEAYTDLGAALTSTYMETEEFEAKTERFESIANKITNNSEKEEGETNAFLSFFAKIFKFLSDMFLRFFGGKGFSDILK